MVNIWPRVIIRGLTVAARAKALNIGKKFGCLG